MSRRLPGSSVVGGRSLIGVFMACLSNARTRRRRVPLREVRIDIRYVCPGGHWQRESVAQAPVLGGWASLSTTLPKAERSAPVTRPSSGIALSVERLEGVVAVVVVARCGVGVAGAGFVLGLRTWSSSAAGTALLVTVW